MRVLKTLVLALGLYSVAALASPTDPKNGVEYVTLPVAQNTDSGKKIEVTEFFAYYCPHCYSFDPVLAAWVKKQGDAIVFKRVHVSRDDNVAPQQRLFFTLEAMGLAEQYHSKVFQTMHVDHNRLNRDDAVFEFVGKQGLDRTKFADAYRSFGVTARVRRADAMMTAYKVESWPMVAIDGRFITSPAHANQGTHAAQTDEQLHAQAITVMDYVLAKAKAEKK
ncbi:MAG: thiol:disulfide interchange protein DsbA/DsbL [Pseudomonadota bacterium]